MSDKYKEYEGAVNVNSNLTPVSRTPIDQIDSSRWHELSSWQLVDQRVLIYDRIEMASRTGHENMIIQLKRGLTRIDDILNQRRIEHGDEITLI